MYCGKCGKAVESSALFCPSCGSKMENSVSSSHSKVVRNGDVRKKRAIGILAAVALVICLIIVVMNSMGDSISGRVPSDEQMLEDYRNWFSNSSWSYDTIEVILSTSENREFRADVVVKGSGRYADIRTEATMIYFRYDQGWLLESINSIGNTSFYVTLGMCETTFNNWFTNNQETHFRESDCVSVVRSEMDYAGGLQRFVVLFERCNTLVTTSGQKEILFIYNPSHDNWNFYSSNIIEETPVLNILGEWTSEYAMSWCSRSVNATNPPRLTVTYVSESNSEIHLVYYRPTSSGTVNGERLVGRLFKWHWDEFGLTTRGSSFIETICSDETSFHFALFDLNGERVCETFSSIISFHIAGDLCSERWRQKDSNAPALFWAASIMQRPLGWDSNVCLSDSTTEGDAGESSSSIMGEPDYITIAGVQYSTSETELVLAEEGLADVDIVQLRYMRNLRVLCLEGNFISDLSPLAGLTNLEWLDLRDNQISDLSPLAGLTNLEWLSLGDNQISDLSSLAGLMNLELLRLWNNQISNLSPLAGLTNLWRLYLSGNQINDVSPLVGLMNLEMLDLGDNQISDLSPLAGLTNLEWLVLFDNQISDLSPLAGLMNLLGLFLDNNQISDLSPLEGLTNLEWLFLSDNQISDLSPLAGLMNLLGLFLDNNQINDFSYVEHVPTLYY